VVIDEALRIPDRIYVGGQWTSSSDSSEFEVRDPSDASVIASVANATTVEALACVDAAHLAGPAWAKTAPRERAEILRRTFELMTQQSERIATLIVRENGKPLADARSETAYAAEFFRWYSEEAVRNEGTVAISPSGANRIIVIHQPVGVCVLVTPWNFPAAMATRKIGPALAAGCTVILKPASDTPLTALLMASILEEAGVPPGVVNVLPSNRSGEVVAAMVDDPRVRKLSFTGSTEVGRVLLKLAAGSVVNTSMELGGNAPFLVFADADLNAAVDGAMIAKMRNIGEACTAANRFYVEEAVADEFAGLLADRMGALKMGSGLDESVQVGPLINEAAREKVDRLLADAVGRGAEVVSGGRRPDRPGYYFEPTVVKDVVEGSAILQEEIFGPVAPVSTFTTEDEAVAMANDTEFGLVSYLYTGDMKRGLRVAEALEAGMIGLNRGLVSDPAAPFGGVKQSGIGREGGHEGLLDYTESKYIATEW
jgi:succinate-semialdehyde dehydrogenase/glutarate-semialdehyde dehydrogenase